MESQENKNFDELVAHLSELEKEMVSQTLGLLEKYFKELDFDNFRQKLVSAKNYKNGLIIQTFNKKIKQKYKEKIRSRTYKPLLEELEKYI